MYRIVYFVWAIVPASFIFMALNAFLKQLARVPGKHSGSDHLKQGLFCLLPLAAAIIFDIYVYAGLVAHLDFSKQTTDIISWLLFPMFLVIFAEIDRRIRKRSLSASGSKYSGTYDYGS